MRIAPVVIVSLALFGAAALDAAAGPERISYPADYRTRFVPFGTVDRPDRNPKQVRFLYVNPEAAAAARGDQPAPEGTVLVMVDRRAQTDAAGNPVLGPDGRYVATDEVLQVAVQEKRRGWGAEYPDNLRNGDWDYATFAPDGSRRPTNSAACLGCHKPRASLDYTFAFQRWVIDGKPRD